MPTATTTVAAKEVETKETPAVKEFNAIPWIKHNIGKEKDETLDIKRVFGDFYRVNWRKPEETGLSGLVTYRIVKSAFVHCVEVDGKPVIEVR